MNPKEISAEKEGELVMVVAMAMALVHHDWGPPNEDSWMQFTPKARAAVKVLQPMMDTVLWRKRHKLSGFVCASTSGA